MHIVIKTWLYSKYSILSKVLDPTFVQTDCGVHRSVVCPLRDRTSHPAHSFVEIILPSSADSSCQLLVKEWALDTGKLPPGGLLRNSMVQVADRSDLSYL